MSIEDPERNPASYSDGTLMFGGRVVYPDGIVGTSWIASNPAASTAWARQKASAYVYCFPPNEGMFAVYSLAKGQAFFLTDGDEWLEVRGNIPW